MRYTFVFIEQKIGSKKNSWKPMDLISLFKAYTG